MFSETHLSVLRKLYIVERDTLETAFSRNIEETNFSLLLPLSINRNLYKKKHKTTLKGREKSAQLRALRCKKQHNGTFPGLFFCFTDLWVGKIPWRRKWQPAPVFSPGESHGQRSLAGSSPWDGRKSDMTEWTTFSPTLYRSQNCCWGSQQPRNTDKEKRKSTCKTLLSVAEEPKVRSSNKENFQTPQ